MLDDKNWENSPKFYAEDIKVNWFTRYKGLEKYFTLCVVAGFVENVFVVSPAHMKQLVQMLKFNVDRYEEQNGVIPVKWEPAIPSTFFNDVPPNNDIGMPPPEKRSKK